MTILPITLSPEDLNRIGRIGGWAPGSYMGKCGDCGGEITAAKRAIRCFVCAVVAAKTVSVDVPVAEAMSLLSPAGRAAARIALDLASKKS